MNKKKKQALMEGKIEDLKKLRKQQADILSSLNATEEEEEYKALLNDLKLIREMILETEASIISLENNRKGEKVPLVTAAITTAGSLVGLFGISFFEKNEGLLRGNGAFGKWKLPGK